MKRVFCGFFMTICLCGASIFGASAIDTDMTVRVGLNYASGALPTASLDNDDADGKKGYEIGWYDLEGSFRSIASIPNELITMRPDNGGIAVTDTDSGAVLYRTDSDTLGVYPVGAYAWFQNNKYTGGFQYINTGSALTVINYVNIEEYVKGVLPYEMTASWNVEALKAQAVCARSYVYGSLNKHEKYGFDVCNTTNCQVYRGAVRATVNSDRAVDETAGEILFYDSDPVIGFFFSSDGGATEDAENVWGAPYPYLIGKEDPYEDTASAYVGYWDTTLTASEVAAKLKSAGKDVGPVANIRITKYTRVGNVNEVTVTGTNGSQVMLKNSACRTTFGLNSIRYQIVGGEAAAAASTPTSGFYINGATASERTLYAIGADGTKQKIDSLSGKTVVTASGKVVLAATAVPAVDAGTAVSGSCYTFKGAGWGHSVGMSQHGAKCMADQGFDYEEILKFYFTDIEVDK